MAQCTCYSSEKCCLPYTTVCLSMITLSHFNTVEGYLLKIYYEVIIVKVQVATCSTLAILSCLPSDGCV